MIQNVLTHLGGVQHFGVVSLCLFCTVFVGVLIWAFLQKKSHLEYMARVVLDHGSEEADEVPHRLTETVDGAGAHRPIRSLRKN
jgi:hypothetical protein